MGASDRDRWWRERGERELRALLYQWDPVGVAQEPDWPGDEYDDYIVPLRERLDSGATAGELAVFLEQQVRDHVGLAPDPDREERFAAQLVDWHQSQAS